jgi:hypothetical protein
LPRRYAKRAAIHMTSADTDYPVSYLESAYVAALEQDGAEKDGHSGDGGGHCGLWRHRKVGQGVQAANPGQEAGEGKHAALLVYATLAYVQSVCNIGIRKCVRVGEAQHVNLAMAACE